MGGNCCKTSGDIEIQFKQTNTFTNRIRYNDNNEENNLGMLENIIRSDNDMNKEGKMVI